MSGRVYYIDFIQNEIKEGNMGVIKCDMRGFFCVLHLPKQFHELKCSVYAVTEQEEKIHLTVINVLQGKGQARCDIEITKMREWKSIWIQVSTNIYGICKLKSEDKIKLEQKKTQIEADRKRIEKEMAEEKQIEQSNKYCTEEKAKIEYKKSAKEGKDTFIESLPPMKTDKWEQLLQMYPQVHIFPEAETIVIKPKDMIVLTKEYQDLATNSFVLHAYYNYRQLLLIRYHNKTQNQYYIGVPGIYFEREKRVALLFGFEGFENGEARLAQASGKSIYTGCFGYYVKQVEI